MKYVVFATLLGRKTRVGEPTALYGVAEVAVEQLRARGLHAWLEVRTRSQVDA